MRKTIALLTSILLFSASCGEASKEKKTREETPAVVKGNTEKDTLSPASEEKEEEPFVLTEENAIDFFFDYQKGLTENKVKITTSLGSFTVELYDNVPYHKANFIYLTRKGYFDNTMFHRVVKDFIIQGGNADNLETAKKRKEIGRYLLPPDTRKGYKHHRGTISMPSSEIDNPHMLASPYEFFIVVTKPGSYHLDGDYTPFGKVISGMDVVDLINQQPVDDGDWPMRNIYIEKAEVIK
ncbi:peptidylprolyl isomerase [Lentiprolixibacter aurantiacus]|uniref:Peptidyl-prolyl cis-trans isomerase n=1 Tax=Lentiprolixibacter aurantiacus TaxID=2993939 RepID=A0AAE3MM54_9FLAO|nr:peptidylprolyl isomerase [Lentiprolixibacter aurantiacus]MCX2719989.1 peptidylprolyl isomerase [Lentiprolixibacter aurantiacus]